MIIDPGAITLIQSTFLVHINAAFATAAHYALRLLYLFAVLEVVIVGLIWALQRDLGLDRVFFKIIKIGLIFFIIQNYAYLIDVVVKSFSELAGVVVSNAAALQYVFNPAKIWQYGYNASIHLLQLASIGNNFGLVMIQIILGMGILFVFGLLGIQMAVQMVSFYVVSFGSLILLPFGAFTPSRGMFDRAVQAVLQAGIRLMALIIVIGVAVVVWNGFQLGELAEGAKFNINQPLGLFFTGLLFLCLALYLPRALSEAVGSVSSGFGESAALLHAATTENISAAQAVSSGISDTQAATVIDIGNASQVSGSFYKETGNAAGTVVNTSGFAGGAEAKLTKEALAQASAMSKSISDNTVKKIKEAVAQAIKGK